MVVTLGASAQDSLSIRFGYLSYEQALQSMPEYKAARENTDKLWGQYEAELKRVEDEFNRKYEDFLDGQRDFPKTILRKRQTELQELMTKNKHGQRGVKKASHKPEKEDFWLTGHIFCGKCGCPPPTSSAIHPSSRRAPQASCRPIPAAT